MPTQAQRSSSCLVLYKQPQRFGIKALADILYTCGAGIQYVLLEQFCGSGSEGSAQFLTDQNQTFFPTDPDPDVNLTN